MSQSAGRMIDTAMILKYIAELRVRALWSRARLERFQLEKLAELIRFARQSSPYYTRVFTGIHEDPLIGELPILDKRTLATCFDEIVTDRSLTAAEAERFVLDDARDDGVAFLRGKYSVTLAGGTSGLKCVSVSDREIATLNTAINLARVSVPTPKKFWTKPRVITLGSTDTRHGSGFRARAMPKTFAQSTSIPADTPINDLIRFLNEKEPDILIGYPSAIMRLVPAKKSGALSIKPVAISCGGERLTKAARELFVETFGCVITSHYGTTECGILAEECKERRLHVHEDIVVFEVVDNNSRPVPAGETGEAVLATHLWKRVVPYIRYRFDDRVRMGIGPCPCGSPFRWIEAIEGRSGTPFHVPGATQETVPVSGWRLAEYSRVETGVLGVQVVLEAPAKIRISVLPLPRASREGLAERVRSRARGYLKDLDANLDLVEVNVHLVEELATIPGSAKTFEFKSELQA